MKIVAIGDIHGHNGWRAIVSSNEDADKIIFIGDYFDSRDPNISAQHQKENFKDIIAYKKANIDKVVLLFGNHEFHYLNITTKKYDGYLKLHQLDIKELINKALSEDLLKMCYIWSNFLFVHAGVTKTWCEDNNIDIDNIQSSINDLFKYKPIAFEFSRGIYNDKYGDEICQTPIWVRPNSLLEDGLDNYVQVVGHTSQDRLTIRGGVVLIDTLGTSGEYLIIKDGEMSAGTINNKLKK